MCISAPRTNYPTTQIYRARKTQCKRMQPDLIIKGISIVFIIVIIIIVIISTTHIFIFICTTPTNSSTSFLFNLSKINGIQASLQYIRLARVPNTLYKHNISVYTLLRIMSYMLRIVSFKAFN